MKKRVVLTLCKQRLKKTWESQTIYIVPLTFNLSLGDRLMLYEIVLHESGEFFVVISFTCRRASFSMLRCPEIPNIMFTMRSEQESLD